MSKYEPVSAEVVAALQTALGAEYVKTDAETLEKYKTDEETDTRYHHLPEVVIWPGSTEEVIKKVEFFRYLTDKLGLEVITDDIIIKIKNFSEVFHGNKAKQ